MEQLTIGDIAAATGGTVLRGSPDTAICGVTTDSRKGCTGRLFVPLIGEKFDGHAFIPMAAQNGAAATLTQRDDVPLPDGIAVVQVANTLAALQALARWYRSRFDIPVVGITGSVGKTTTKDMLSAVLGATRRCLKTQGNFNNEIGLPLTLLELDHTHEIAVVEMGMSGFGEIDRLASIAQPNCAVITNIGMSHIEKLGSQENILRAKMELLSHVRPGGMVVLNGDDPLLWSVRDEVPSAVYVGVENRQCACRAYNVTLGAQEASFNIQYEGSSFPVRLPLPGAHNVYNALVATVVGTLYGVPVQGIQQGLRTFTPSDMRMDIASNGIYTVVNDCYNASPASMEAALQVLAAQEGFRRIAVLGDMLELGDYAYQAHKKVGSAVVSAGIEELVTVGENARLIGEGAFECGMDSENIHSFDENIAAVHYLKTLLRAGDVVLVKASRGMHFEEIAGQLA